MELTFSIEMRSKNQVKNISISDEAHDKVLFEGDLGTIMETSLEEQDVLEIIGTSGVIRVSITEGHLREALRKGSQLRSQLRGGER